MSVLSDIKKSTGQDRSSSTDSLDDFLNKRTDYQTKLNNRNYQFETSIDNFVVNTKARLLAVVRQAISDTVNDAQTPVSKGGKMRVDTGFLRSSGVASLNAPPVGETVGRKRNAGETDKPLSDYATDPDYTKAPILNRALAEMKLGDSFFFGWTARYAKYREAHDGFLESALQKWQTYVDKAVNYFRSKDSAT